MPRPRPPPTPSSSTDLKGLEKTLQSSDMESSFALPPPALRSQAQSQSHTLKLAGNGGASNSTTANTQRTPPVSPKDNPLSSSPRHKRTASGMVKSNTNPESTSNGPNNSSSNSYALPPPPSRARKIIQMKPKSTSSNNHPSPDSDGSYQPPASASAVAPSKASTTNNSAGTNSKRKQPSATSAAGRKIARKTAHSIIERRRRSKMNEEFGVLKDMIPACEGVEMHKLAILQAGIEYLRYLEGCVSQLKVENGKKGEGAEPVDRQQQRTYEYSGGNDEFEEEDDDDEDDEDEDMDQNEDQAGTEPPAKVRINQSRHPRSSDTNNEWSFRDSRNPSVASQSSSAYPSPYLHGQSQTQQSQTDDQQQRQMHKRPVLPTNADSFTASPSQISLYSNGASTAPTPTLLSPAFNSIHFSPDLVRTQTNDSISSGLNSGSLASMPGSWATVNENQPTTKTSPQMVPLPSPEAAMHLPLPPLAANLQLPRPYTLGREVSKSPAAMSDASGTAEATATAALMMLTNDWRASAGAMERGKGKGMSVRDLLSS